MPKSLSSMYGTDDNDFASSIASSALNPSVSLESNTTEGSKGNGTDPGEVVVISNKSDSRAKTSGNH